MHSLPACNYFYTVSVYYIVHITIIHKKNTIIMRSCKLSLVHSFKGVPNFLFLFIFSALIGLQGYSQENYNIKPDGNAGTERSAYVPGEFIVQFNPQVAEQIRDAIYSNQTQTNIPQIDALNNKYGVKKIDRVFKFIESQSANLEKAEEFGLTRTYVLEIPDGANIEEIIKEYSSLDMVVYAEPNFLAKADLVPNDPFYPQQWGLNNTGQADPFGGGGPVGVAGADINIEPAWAIHTGSSSIIIAILDTGVDYNHPEFAGKIVAGYDFINGDNDPMDDGNHGTACAGIAAAAGNNGIGVAGVNWNAQIMPVKVLNSSGSGSYTAVANGVTFAADNGADVLSLSLGGSSNSVTLENAVNYAHSLDCIIMASRGNNNNSNLAYPASFTNAIAIGALSPCDERKDPSTCDGETWWGSSYGSDLDVMAPGTRIYTTDRLGAPGYSTGDYAPAFNGTSAACPFAAGAAALLRSWAPGKTNDEIRTILQQTAVDIEAPGFDNETGYGRLNVFAALQEAGPDEVPLSNWSIVIGLFLILAFVAIRLFR